MKDTTPSAIPSASRSFVRALTSPASAPAPKTAAAVAPDAVAATTPAEFVYAYTEADRTYTAQQYGSDGTWTGTTTPWLNDLASVPADWQWTVGDTEAQAARTLQVEAQMKAMTPPGGYSGSTAAQIQARYSQSMWDTTVFPQDELDSLFVWIDDDAEFARQRLGGANTNVIASADKFDLDAWFKAASNGAALSQLQGQMNTAQSAGELFVCDYRPVLESIVGKYVQAGSFLAAPVAFFQAQSGALTPLAIQIQGEDASSYIFTPADGDDPWLLAKLWVAHADAMWWFSGSHLFNTHSIDMIFGIAALNQMGQATNPLPADHPMLVLAKPHLVKSFNINTAVYSFTGTPGIYQPKSFCDMVLPTGRIGIYEVINNLYSRYDFDANAFDSSLSTRGLDTDKITSFPYRDDGKLWWDALAGFVRSVVDATYTSEGAVAADLPLKAWMKQVQQAFNHDNTTRFTWTETNEGLARVFTNLLFICSAQHTSVNNSMFNGWAFTPNGPFAMQKAPPADAASVSQQYVLDSLPDPTQAGRDGTTLGQPATDMALIQNQVTFVMNGTAEVREILAAPDLHLIYTYPESAPQYQAVSSFQAAMLDGDDSVKAKVSAQQDARIKAYGQTPVPNSVSYYYFSAEAVASMYLNAPATRAIQI